MIALHAFALIAALSTPGQPVLLDFYADWCGPCRSMDPVIRRLVADGYTVRRVNIDREQQLARRFRVDRVPTFVMTLDGREVERVVGPVSYERLARMFAAAGPARAQPAGASPGTASQSSAPSAVAPAPPQAHQAVPTRARAPRSIDPRLRALHATVRLKVEDPKGNSFGTGTVIDVHGEEALVMTCGHIFRDSGGRGKIVVDLFAPGAQGPVPGELISYNLEQDIGLVAIRPGIQITPVPVAPQGYRVRPGDRVFSIGCDRGAPPTIRESQVTAINKFVGPANIVAAGEPVIGRSGGGLFSADGRLIGVCNLADPTDKQGIYAALSLLHENLARIGQSRLFQRDAPQIASAQRSPQGAPQPDHLQPGRPPAMPDRMPASPLTAGGLEPVPGAAVASRGSGAPASSLAFDDDAEVICIVRSKRKPGMRDRVIIFERPPRDLLERLALESQRQPGFEPVIVDAADAQASIASRPARTVSPGRSKDPVVRAQSTR